MFFDVLKGVSFSFMLLYCSFRDTPIEAFVKSLNALSLSLSPDPVSLVRDHNIKEKLVELGISVQSYNGDLLYEPWDVYDESGHAFTTFEAYWNKCLHLQMEPVSPFPPWKLVPASGTF